MHFLLYSLGTDGSGTGPGIAWDWPVTVIEQFERQRPLRRYAVHIDEELDRPARRLNEARHKVPRRTRIV